MAPPQSASTDFPQGWLRAQQQFWDGWAAGATGTESLAEAGPAWSEACEQWWRQVQASVPPPLAPHLQAALRHTQLFMTLAGVGSHAAGAPDLGETLSQLYADTLQAAADAHGAGAEEQRALQAACAALSAAVAQIVTEALGAVRERLAREDAPSPRAVFAIYAEEIEACYLERAGSDAFCALVGDVVNAQVAVLAAARNAT